jgi:hypothetical protein
MQAGLNQTRTMTKIQESIEETITRTQLLDAIATKRLNELRPYSSFFTVFNLRTATETEYKAYKASIQIKSAAAAAIENNKIETLKDKINDITQTFKESLLSGNFTFTKDDKQTVILTVLGHAFEVWIANGGAEIRREVFGGQSFMAIELNDSEQAILRGLIMPFVQAKKKCNNCSTCCCS